MLDVRRVAAAALAIAAYVVVGRLSLLLTTVHLSSSPVWPPAGLAIGLLVVVGLRAWPVVALGAFIVNITTNGSLPVSSAIAAGNTLEAVAAAALIRRFAGTDAFDRLRGMGVVVVAAAAGAAISATVGVSSLVIDGVPGAQFGSIWFTWFLGNLGGTLLVAPLVMQWRRPTWSDGVVLATSTAFGIVAFATNGWTLLVLLPLVAYASLTDHSFRRSITLLGLAGGAVGMTWFGFGPFQGRDGNEALLLLQFFLIGTIMATSILAAGIRQKDSVLRASSWPHVTLAVFPLLAAGMLIGLWFHPTMTALEFERGEETVAEIFDSWRDIIDDYESEMKAIRGLYDASPEVSRDEFDAFVEGQDWTFGPGGITAVGFARVVEANELDDYIQTTRNDANLPPEVSTNFTVFPPPEGRSVPVDHVYPMFPEEGAIGFDLSFSPGGATALERATITNSVIATEPTNIVRPDGEFPGFFLSLPIWKQDAVIGYVVLAQTVHDASTTIPDEGVAYRITDVTGEPVELLATNAMFSVFHERTLSVWGRSWLFEFGGDPRATASEFQSAWFVIGGGAIISLAIAGMVYSYDTTRSRAREMSHSLVDQARLDGERVAEIRRLEDRDEFRRQFLNMVAHELRTPLTPLRTQLYVLQQKAEPKDEKSLAILERGITRLSKVVDDLLIASRLEAKGLALEKQPIDLYVVARNAVNSFAGAAKESDTKLELEGEPAPITADPDRLDQVVDNLLSNALKFTPGGEVRVVVSATSTAVRLEVMDDGLGVEPSKLDELGEPFIQAHDSNQFPVKGTGLGLYICKAIVELHGGKLQIHSDGVGKGTTVTVTLPRPE